MSGRSTRSRGPLTTAADSSATLIALAIAVIVAIGVIALVVVTA